VTTEQSRTNITADRNLGPNEWLVDEIYEQYLKDRDSVDPAWWDFFADYRPGERGAPTPTPTPEPPPVATRKAMPRNPTAGQERKLRGPAARVVANMQESLTVPTATSVRTVPAKLLVDNRIVINNALARSRGGKVSFTHIIGYALVRALQTVPAMNAGYLEESGKPVVVQYDSVNLGLAIDLVKPDGSRQLLVPSIKGAESMDFLSFWMAYEDVVRRARSGDLTVADFEGTTISLTNPGTIGTEHSVPRLMSGQGAIIGVGAMEYPAEWQGASEEALARQGISKVMTLTSTYDHRIIQGAQSGEFLRQIHRLLLGDDGFYNEIFASLRIPYEPIRWAQDIALSHDSEISKTARVQELIHAYRVRGHLMADIDPLEYKQRGHPDLDVASHGLTLWDLDREFATGGFGGQPFMKLRDILKVLRDSYCRTLGVEYMHIQDPEQRQWMQDRLEVPQHRLSREEQLEILHRLNSAEAFETFLQTKFVGQKRFSLEGGESTIAVLDALLKAAGKAAIDEVCIGMPHRGRLNVLANIAGKSYGHIFKEFEGAIHEDSVQGSGDVKYHLGTEGVYTSVDGETTKVYLAANPSHLEAVDSVLEGIVRAKQDMLNRGQEYPVLPLLMHGDAAFAGQGVVAETLNLSQLRGYRTGGTIHLVVNNQVGFTTSPSASRSSWYATDAARMIQAPILHVNGDDPEACVRAARMAFEFRQRFHKDVVIDLVCYRRRGHNEADDPSLTQPTMYKLIDQKRSVRKIYTESLIGRGDITLAEAEQALRDFQGQLERVFAETRGDVDTGEVEAAVEKEPAPLYPLHIETAISPETLKHIATSQVDLPADLNVHTRLRPQLERRARMIEDGTIDWAMAETLAFGSVLLEGRTVRLAGQDSRRGTFGQRHAVIVDRESGEGYAPLQNLSDTQGRFYVYDSMLSEFAALGFEYGYSVARPEALVLWEAQFGDFANGAQTIIDEFISSGEQKWEQTSRVVMLLPHGYEGQGPDHSSARVERYLQLCAQDNMTVAMPSTPASYFHLLRWQVNGPQYKPLVVFTPKSMLRNKRAISVASDFTSGAFEPVIDSGGVAAERVRRIILCTGKITWDLLTAREKAGIDDAAIVRLERLYPLPGAEIADILTRYPADAEVRWVQEEPMNQGAYQFIAVNLPEYLDGRPLHLSSRTASAAPATGSHQTHELEQKAVVESALA
jgi:multifunctional 2-oxoglutarate metabolism enzyme